MQWWLVNIQTLRLLISHNTEVEVRSFANHLWMIMQLIRQLDSHLNCGFIEERES